MNFKNVSEPIKEFSKEFKILKSQSRDSQATVKIEGKKLRNTGKISKNGWKQSLVPSLTSRNKHLALVVKNYAKIYTKVSSS